MKPAEFWKLIEQIDCEALGRGDEEGAIAPLATALEPLDVASRQGFCEQLAEALYALDTRAHADAAGESSDSDDAFLYARCYVVARGRAYHERVLADPSAMPTRLEDWCESLLYVAGEDEDSSFSTSVSYESGSNKAKW